MYIDIHVIYLCHMSQEQFSIVLPRAYLDSVSCLLSLCSKSRLIIIIMRILVMQILMVLTVAMMITMVIWSDGITRQS